MTSGEWTSGEYLYKLKDQEVIVIVAPLNPTQELSTFCGLCRTPYEGDECPTCRAEREEAKRVIEERLRRDRREKEKFLDDLEEWLNQLGDEV